MQMRSHQALDKHRNRHTAFTGVLERMSKMALPRTMVSSGSMSSSIRLHTEDYLVHRRNGILGSQCISWLVWFIPRKLYIQYVQGLVQFSFYIRRHIELR
jgi:hypothetical protein